MSSSLATFAAGCFWCTEAIYMRVRGILTVTSGYTGGSVDHPKYESVSTGTTGHAEAIQLSFNPQEITYNTLLEIFFATHDPTTKNQQGADRGTQYRSAIFYHSVAQKKEAEAMIQKLTRERVYPNAIVTEVIPFTAFYPAEEYHQQFYEKNQQYPYCTIVINPKLTTLLEKFRKQVKEEYLV